jgi:hypothetical protein
MVGTLILSIVHKCGVGLLRSMATRRKTQDKIEAWAAPSEPLGPTRTASGPALVEPHIKHSHTTRLVLHPSFGLFHSHARERCGP